MQISSTQWHSLPAYTLENDHLRVVIVPQQGAKIASIFDKRNGREWLIQPTVSPVRPVPYGAPYHEYDMNSWDEMFPTILTCEYPGNGVFSGKVLPDHGEVWAMPWTVDASDANGLALSVVGRALPYTLARRATLEAPATLRLDYHVTNTSPEALYYLWAAHPLYAVDEQTEIVLPPQVKQLYNVHDVPPWGAHGTRHDFPNPKTEDDKNWDLRRIGAATRKDCRKFYVPPEIPVGWGALRQLDSGAWLRVDWDAATLPYLGIWIDEGSYATVPTIALEPTNGFYDGLHIAHERGQVVSLAPAQTHTWTLRVAVDAGSTPLDVS